MSVYNHDNVSELSHFSSPFVNLFKRMMSHKLFYAKPF